jgi:histidinol-phosphate/aromatic aminotransferase/cobyric acid decarboxylase-like protein/choline kinase
MQAVILAAGMGNRLGKYTKNNTKCMLDINGITLIERALGALESNGIKKCVIVVGYQKENLMNFIGKKFRSMEIVYVSNDIYNRTNNIYSLYLAKDFLIEDDTILLESDLIFDASIITRLLASPEKTLAVVAKYESWMDGTVVQIKDDLTIAQFIPKSLFNYANLDSYYKTVNIYKFSKNFLCSSYVPFLEAYSKAMGNNEYYEQVLRVIATLETHPLKALCLDGQKWYEIDDVQDKDIAEVLFADNAEDKYERLQKRFGGYWRFPHMLDFCYLVNPYFPNRVMNDEMKAYFTQLVADYPSGLSVQNLLAGKLFSIDESQILVGNGAAELIKALSPALKGSIGVIYPSFNEYPESLSEHEIVAFHSDGFHYGLDELISWQKKCDNLLIINPDNPSGNFVSKQDLLSLLAIMREQNKTLVLDESFLDFSIGGFENSLLDQAIIDRYPNLIIIKSISKSYGVPGLRLGILASSNPETIRVIRKGLSIWNINSFGEFFFQIIGKYKKDYQAACAKIIEERTRFIDVLDATGLLEILPSQANYLMCRLKSGMTARQLALHLLSDHDIFIKDLTGKKGIVGNQWFRIAIRGKEDNDRLVEAIRKIAR